MHRSTDWSTNGKNILNFLQTQFLKTANDQPAPYEIIEKIGAGNSGEVYKAYHKNLKKYVVLKKIRAEIKDCLLYTSRCV